MLVAEDITDYIFQILQERKHVINQNKTFNLNFHCDDSYSKDVIKKRVDACINISEEFEVEGPTYKEQSCFLSRKPHSHIEFTIKMFS